jgi:hypothetical protein
VLQNDVERARCELEAGDCTFFLLGSGADAMTDFVYFAYTLDRFSVVNTSPDRWMPLTETPITGEGVDGGIIAGDEIFADEDIIGSASWLAPGQCYLFLTPDATGETPPQPCDVVATYHELEVDFWNQPFSVESGATDSALRECPPAAPGATPTLCVMPR